MVQQAKLPDSIFGSMTISIYLTLTVDWVACKE